MIKIEPLFVTDYSQTRALLRLQPDYLPAEHVCNHKAFFFRGLAFWQHWLPCSWHFAPSVYVAKEDGVILGLVALRPTGKSKDCWLIDHLVVHPHHRGRGVAQELLRYVFALFGSQGVSHFLSEVSDQNSAALSLFGNCGFRRAAKVTHYAMNLHEKPFRVPDMSLPFRLATQADKQNLFQLHQDVLPADIRQVFSYSPDDFAVPERSYEGVPKARKRSFAPRSWFWVLEDNERKVLTCAARVIAHDEHDYHLEFAVHPGWKHLAPDLVAFCLNAIRGFSPRGEVTAKAFDFENELIEALKENGFERSGGFCLLAREHWVRAKRPEKAAERPAVGIPAVNFPLATERSIAEEA